MTQHTSHNKIKELRVKNNFSQEEMAEALHISQNAYSLIESGKTRLVDEERIQIISEKFGVSPMELGLLHGWSSSQTFNDKVENGYASYIQTLNSENKELVQSVLAQLTIKDRRIDELMKLLANQHQKNLL